MKTQTITCTWLIVFFLFIGITTLHAQKKSGFGNILKKIEAATETVTGTEKETTQNQPTAQSVQTTGNEAIKPHLTPNTKVFRINNYVSKYVFSDGLLCVHDTKKGKYGFIDAEGNLKIDFLWDTNFIGDPIFNSGYCVVHKTVNSKKRFFIIDHAGKETMLPESYFQVSDFVEGRAIAFDRTGAKVTVLYIDHTGKQIFPELARSPKISPSDFGKPRPYKDGLAAYFDADTKKWGFHDEKGKLVIQPQFSKVDDFYDGLASVQEFTENGQGKWGYVDATGKMVIAPTFSYMPSCFSEGTAVIKKQNNKYCAIDKTGNIISEEFDRLTPFYEGFAFAKINRQGTKTVVLDKSFNEVREIEDFPFPSQEGYTVIRFFDGLAAVNGNSIPEEIRGWVINPQGETVITRKVTNARIGNFFDGLAYCYAQFDYVEYSGFINKKGEYVLIFQKEEL